MAHLACAEMSWIWHQHTLHAVYMQEQDNSSVSEALRANGTVVSNVQHGIQQNTRL